MKELIVIGAGPGDENYIIPAAVQAVNGADIVIGDRRLLKAFGLKPDGEGVWLMDKMMATIHAMAKIDDEKQTVVLVSGDPGFYSMLNLLQRTYPEVPMRVIPGLSSFSVFAAKLGETLIDAKLTSAHGREMSEEKLIELVKSYGKVFLLCDSMHDPSWMAKTLCDAGLGCTYMAAGSELTYPEERIATGPAKDFVDKTWSGMSVVLIKDTRMNTKQMVAPVSWQESKKGWLADTDFIRNQTPMTAEELRWIIMGKLKLQPDETFWDIGAGTGSVSVEASLHLTQGRVYAFERNKSALEVLVQNKEKFKCDNLTLIEGEAPEILSGIPAPDAVFIGGAGRKLAEILAFLQGLNKKMRIIIPAVTIETQSEAFVLCSSMDGFMAPEMMTIAIGKSRQLGSYHMIEQGHHVALIMTEI